MSIFAWLLIGHLIGDWMLQNDWMARNKRGRWWSLPCIVHCLIYSIVIVQTVWIGSRGTVPLEQLSMIFVFILLSHWVIDGLDLAALWGRVINQTQTDYVRVVVDQTMHMIVLGAMVSLFLA